MNNINVIKSESEISEELSKEIENISIGSYVYWARILKPLGVYDVLDLRVRTVEDDYIVAVDGKTKQSHMFSKKNIGKVVFTSRGMALDKVREAETSEE